jgi:hypothetical protein
MHEWQPGQPVPAQPDLARVRTMLQTTMSKTAGIDVRCEVSVHALNAERVVSLHPQRVLERAHPPVSSS